VRLRSKRAFLIFLSLALSVISAFSLIRTTSAGIGSTWISTDPPQLSKVVDVSASALSENYTVNCAKTTYLPDGQTTVQTVCTYLSPLGVLATDGRIEIGPNKFARLTGPGSGSTFIPSPDPSMALLSLSAPTIGNEIGIYRALSKSDLLPVFTDGQGTYYQVTKQPDQLLRDPKTRQPLQLNTDDVVFSANGQWMLVDLPQQGLLRVNMFDLSTELFAAPIEPAWFLGLANPALAISDDGRYAAENTTTWGDNLNIYDLSTCTDQLDVPQKDAVYCAGKNILQGWTLDGRPMGKGLLDQQADLKRVSRLQFANDDTVEFTAQYNIKSASDFKVAEFTATAPNAVTHKLGLLGMGDSYISGQGAFDYTHESNDSDDTCHISLLAYPFVLGQEYFNSYNSIACSGAKTDKITGTSKAFQGQVNDKIEEQYRDKPNILSNFLPGYIYQQEFAENYTPEAILLSVGGDDIGFADIVKSCVANSGGGTCYNTYEDRAELVEEINATYPKLVNTYTTLRNVSGGARIYVVGYPQVAKVGGDCGLNVHLNADEILFASRLIDYLDNVVQQAAQTAGVQYVDTQHAFDGHRLCESGDKAMNGFTLGGDAGVTIHKHEVNFIGSESYHPTQLGYKLLAQTIAAETDDLAEPMPVATPFVSPIFDPSIPLLTSVAKIGRVVQTVSYDVDLTSDALVRSDTAQLVVNNPELQLQPGSRYQVVLHSTPMLLDEGGVDANDIITTAVHIPNDTDPGYHTLHIYATNMAGEAIDIQKIVYVAASVDSLASDTTSGNGAVCLVVLPSGQDVDHDGIDDACDPEIKTVQPAAIAAQNVQVDPHVGDVKPQSGQILIRNDTGATSSSQPIGTLNGLTGSSVQPSVPTVRKLAKTPVSRLFRLNWVQVGALFMSVTIGGAAITTKKT